MRASHTILLKTNDFNSMKRIVIFFVTVLAFIFPGKANEKRVFFNLKFGIIKGGEAELVISDTLLGTRKAIRYYLAGRTTGITDKLFGVNDIYETFVDAKTYLPIKSVRNIKEGRYRWYNETFYYHDIDSIYSQRSGWRHVPENLVDIISVFFYFINQHLINDLEKGLQLTYPTFHADKISDITISFLGSDKIEIGKSKTDCYILAPKVDKGKLMKRSDGLKFFISKETELPLLLEFDMKVGALRAVIEKYTINGVEQVIK